MFDPELYVGAWRLPGEAWRTTKYSDGGAVPEGAETSVWERRVYYCVPVPGEAGWARGDAPGGGGAAHGCGCGAASQAASRADKRRRGEAGEEDASMDTDASAPTPDASPACAESKRTRPHEGADAAAAAAASPDAAQPAAGLPPDASGQGFILKARRRASRTPPPARSLPAVLHAS